ncbi:DUF6241 domain-containing protein [Oceanobacillus damuensis]|uniref:DUF6241 domain-containing protein n=1 Tax=Oceanobacillus damuensis TaxID=937928 RepID=UPI000B06A113|nr:DUF6241 domain-containing protein [Oceanobacillus damuensis]
MPNTLEVADLTYGIEYRAILEKWAVDDFSEVDKDPNAIWEMQGGTIGELQEY